MVETRKGALEVAIYTEQTRKLTHTFSLISKKYLSYKNLYIKLISIQFSETLFNGNTDAMSCA